MKRASATTRMSRRGAQAALVTAISAVAIAACGGSGSKPSASSSPYGPADSPVALSRCMRANGVSSFPDPTQGSGGVGFNGLVVTAGATTMVVDGITFSGPALQRAQKACKAYLPPGGPPPALPASEKAAALANARCMREHGITNFPDPNFSAGAPGIHLGAGLNPQSPAFEQAAKACGLGAGIRVRVGSP